MAVLNFWPILAGRVPLPARLVTQFPPWETVRGPDFAMPRHAELGDLVTHFYPWRSFLHQSLKEGSFPPLWNPHALLGTPLQAESQSALFYPLNALYYALPTPVAWSVGFPLREFLAWLLTYLFARALGATPAGAVAAGLVFGFCGFLTAFNGAAIADSSLWIPLVCLSVARLERRASARAIALAGLAFALPVLAGHLENSAYVTAVGVAFFLWRWLWRPDPGEGSVPARPRKAGALLLAGLLALMLAAVQVLPTIEWVGNLNRTLNKKWTARPPAHIAAFVSRDAVTNPNSANVPIPEGAAYPGMLALLLAPLALLRKDRRDAVFFGVLAVCCLQVIYGLGPLYVLSRAIPVMRGMANARLLMVVDFSLAVLAGLGLSGLEERLRGRDRSRSLAWWLLSGLAALVCAIGIAAIAGPGDPGSWLRGPKGSWLFLLASGAALAAILAGRLTARQTAAACVGILGLDLFTFSHGTIPFVPPKEIFPPAPVFDFLRGRAGTTERVASVDIAYAANFEMMYGLSSAGGSDTLLRRTARVLEVLCPPSDAALPSSEKILGAPGRVLDLMNVRYLVATTVNSGAAALASRPERFTQVFTDGSVHVFENKTALPRAFLVPAAGVEAISGDDEQLARLRDPGFDPAASVILASKPGKEDSRSPGGEVPAKAEVRGFESGVGAMSLRALAPEPSLLVISETWYPGWTATVEGRETPVERADYDFMAVRLGAGAHDVRLLFRPKPFRLGAILSAAGVAAAVALSVIRARQAPG